MKKQTRPPRQSSSTIQTGKQFSRQLIHTLQTSNKPSIFPTPTPLQAEKVGRVWVLRFPLPTSLLSLVPPKLSSIFSDYEPPFHIYSPSMFHHLLLRLFPRSSLRQPARLISHFWTYICPISPHYELPRQMRAHSARSIASEAMTIPPWRRDWKRRKSKMKKKSGRRLAHLEAFAT